MQVCVTKPGGETSMVVLPFGENERVEIQDMRSLSVVESTKILQQSSGGNTTDTSGYFHFTIGKVCITAGKMASLAAPRPLVRIFTGNPPAGGELQWPYYITYSVLLQTVFPSQRFAIRTDKTKIFPVQSIADGLKDHQVVRAKACRHCLPAAHHYTRHRRVNGSS